MYPKFNGNLKESVSIPMGSTCHEVDYMDIKYADSLIGFAACIMFTSFFTLICTKIDTENLFKQWDVLVHSRLEAQSKKIL